MHHCQTQAVLRATNQIASLSPSATMSSILNSKSGNALRHEVTASFAASGPIRSRLGKLKKNVYYVIVRATLEA